MDDPEKWLHMRPAVFWAHANMLPRLQAEESLARINETGAGSGTMDEQAQKEFKADLRRVAQPRGQKAKGASLAMMKELGIEIVGDVGEG